jgi:hypothetical protein
VKTGCCEELVFLHDDVQLLKDFPEEIFTFPIPNTDNTTTIANLVEKSNPQYQYLLGCGGDDGTPNYLVNHTPGVSRKLGAEPTCK